MPRCLRKILKIWETQHIEKGSSHFVRMYEYILNNNFPKWE
jgi:hypothetical protein